MKSKTTTRNKKQKSQLNKGEQPHVVVWLAHNAGTVCAQVPTDTDPTKWSKDRLFRFSADAMLERLMLGGSRDERAARKMMLDGEVRCAPFSNKSCADAFDDGFKAMWNVLVSYGAKRMAG